MLSDLFSLTKILHPSPSVPYAGSVIKLQTSKARAASSFWTLLETLISNQPLPTLVANTLNFFEGTLRNNFTHWQYT